MPRIRTGASQRPDTEETCRAILRAAHDLFMEHGYRVVTTRMVADASGVKQPLLYYHFADKETLYLEVHREKSLASHIALERIVARHNESIEARLYDVTRYLRQSRQHNMGMFFYELEHEMSPDMRLALKELFQTQILAPIITLFEDGIATGFLRSPQRGGVPPRLAAYLLLNTISNMPSKIEDEVLANRKDLPEKKCDIAGAVVHMLLYGMVACPAHDFSDT